MAPEASGSGSGGRAKGQKLSTLENKLHKQGCSAPNQGQTLKQHELVAVAGPGSDIETAVNSLIRLGLVEVLTMADGKVMFKFRSKDEAKRMGEMETEERQVFEAIKSGGNQGMWTKTIANQTGLPRHTMNKALKALESRKAIKTVKSVKFPTRKTYMLAGINPSADLTGGPWFTDNELDEAFVKTLRKCAYSFIKERTMPKGYREGKHVAYPYSTTDNLPGVHEINEFIKSLGISSVELSDEHVEALLDLMVVDGQIEKVSVGRRDLSPAQQKKKRKEMKKRKREEEEDDDGGKGKGKGKKRGRPPAKKSRLTAAQSDSDTEDDIDSDEDVPVRKRASNNSDSDDDDDDSDAPRRSSKASSKRRKKARGPIADTDDEGELSEVSSVGSTSGRGANGFGSGRRRGYGGDDNPDGVYDQEADEQTSIYAYRWIKPYKPMLGWPDMPCGKCPVEEFCSEPAGFSVHPPPSTLTTASRYGSSTKFKPNMRRALQHQNRDDKGKGKEGAGAGAGEGKPRVEIAVDAAGSGVSSGTDGMQGIGMLGGAGAAIGTSNARWGDQTANVGFGVAPVNPKTCRYFQEWLKF